MAGLIPMRCPERSCALHCPMAPPLVPAASLHGTQPRPWRACEGCRQPPLTSRTMWVMPALKPMKAVRWGGLEGSSRGKLLTLPRPRRHRFRGVKPREPHRGSAGGGRRRGWGQDGVGDARYIARGGCMEGHRRCREVAAPRACSEAGARLRRTPLVMLQPYWQGRCRGAGAGDHAACPWLPHSGCACCHAFTRRLPQPANCSAHAAAAVMTAEGQLRRPPQHGCMGTAGRLQQPRWPASRCELLQQHMPHAQTRTAHATARKPPHGPPPPAPQRPSCAHARTCDGSWLQSRRKKGTRLGRKRPSIQGSFPAGPAELRSVTLVRVRVLMARGCPEHEYIIAPSPGVYREDTQCRAEPGYHNLRQPVATLHQGHSRRATHAGSPRRG